MVFFHQECTACHHLSTRYFVPRLTDLVAEANASRPGVRFKDDSRTPAIGRGGKKADIYQVVGTGNTMYIIY